MPPKVLPETFGGISYGISTFASDILRTTTAKATASEATIAASSTFVTRLRCYDILNRISNYSYTTNAQAHTEIWRNTLHRYLLLILQYKLNVNPKKKP